MPKTQDSSPTDRKRTEWLLKFLRRDLENLTPGQLVDLRLESVPFCLGLAPDERRAGDSKWPPDSADWDDPQQLLGEIQAELRKAISLLESGLPWFPFGAAADEIADYERRHGEKVEVPRFLTPRQPPGWMVEPVADGTLRRVYTGSIETTFRMEAAELLIACWPMIRRCRHEPCRTLFLPRHGRQRYHTPACSNRARQARRPRKDRDHHKEHKRRVRNKLPKGAKVKVGRRGKKARKGGKS